jgi:putative ABC transport system permease protein
LLDDLRYAFRQLRTHPAFALVAVATLALGIGAAAAMFGLIQGVLLSPPPYTDPDRVVLVTPVRVDGQPYDRSPTTGQWLAWRRSKTLARTAPYRWTFNFLVRGDGSRSLGGMNVSREYFEVLGIKPILGRVFTASETSRPGVPGKPGAPPTAILLGHDLWQREFAGDPGIVGKTVTLSRMPAPLPVVGVMPPGVRFLPDPGAAAEPNYDVDAKVDFWLGTTPDEVDLQRGTGNLIARLAPGATAPQAQAELAAMSKVIAAADTRLAGLTTVVNPVRAVLNRDGERLLVPLFGAVGLLFLIACANVSGLLVARGLQRQAEYATRAAMGAGRARLFRLVLIEAVTIALTAGVVGAGVAAGIVTVLRAIGGRAVPRADAVAVGWPVLLFGVAAALVAGIVAGLLPAVRASWGDRAALLKGTRTTAGRVERRLLAGVAAVQVVLTVALLAGAALLIRTAQNLDRVRPGYETERVLAMTVTHVGDRQQYRAFHDQAIERVAAIPGVRHAAFAWGLPLTGNSWPAELEVVGRAAASSAIVDRISLPQRSVSEDYFAVMRIVNQAFVRRHLDGGPAIGRQLKFSGNDKPLTIVGVLADTRTERLRELPEPELYTPFRQNGAFSKHLVVRAAGDPLALAPQVRDALRALQPTVAVEHVTTMDAIRRESTAAQIFALRLLAGFGLVATLLAAVGLYGVLSLSVGARTKELAVRQAIGARRSQVVGLVLGEGARLIAVGVVLGLGGALLVGRLLEALLFDVAASDPVSLAAAALGFGAVATLACLLPAWRAGRADVYAALRQD